VHITFKRNSVVADIGRKRDRLKERRDREAEKIRTEQLAAKMSAKKLQRMKKVRRCVIWLVDQSLTNSVKDERRRSADSHSVDSLFSILITCTFVTLGSSIMRSLQGTGSHH
jgi:hypothetical protein